MTAIASRGFAVISAMLVAASVAGIGTYLLWQGSLAVRQSENITAAHQASSLARAAASAAAAALVQDDPRVDHRGEVWARGVPVIEVDGMRADATISDEQGKFNVNNLADVNGVSEIDVAAFRRLLKQVGLPESLADAVVDWIDADDMVTAPAGAEDADYLALEQGYRAANRQIADISELLLVKGFNADRLNRVAPYLTALPHGARVNVNTASAELLAAVLPGLSVGAAKTIVAGRDKEPFTSRIEFARRLPDGAAKAAIDLLDVRSDYFVAHGTVHGGRISAPYRALIGREGPTVISVAKEFG